MIKPRPSSSSWRSTCSIHLHCTDSSAKSRSTSSSLHPSSSVHRPNLAALVQLPPLSVHCPRSQHPLTHLARPVLPYMPCFLLQIPARRRFASHVAASEYPRSLPFLCSQGHAVDIAYHLAHGFTSKMALEPNFNPLPITQPVKSRLQGRQTQNPQYVHTISPSPNTLAVSSDLRGILATVISREIARS